MIRHNAYCSTCGIYHRFGNPGGRYSVEGPACEEGMPPPGANLEDSAGWLDMGDSASGGHQHGIAVHLNKPGIVTFELEVYIDGSSERCMHEFQQEIPLAEFLGKLGLHREAVAGDLFDALRNFLDLHSVASADADGIETKTCDCEACVIGRAAVAKANGGRPDA